MLQVPKQKDPITPSVPDQCPGIEGNRPGIWNATGAKTERPHYTQCPGPVSRNLRKPTGNMECYKCQNRKTPLHPVSRTSVPEFKETDREYGMLQVPKQKDPITPSVPERTWYFLGSTHRPSLPFPDTLTSINSLADTKA